MARKAHDQDYTPILKAAQNWIQSCLVNDRSLFTPKNIWTSGNLERLRAAFIEHPLDDDDSFLKKLERQLLQESPDIHLLAAELLWAMDLFPSKLKPKTKRDKLAKVAPEGTIPHDHPLLHNQILQGVGSTGPGYPNHFWREFAYAIRLVLHVKRLPEAQRHKVFTDYGELLSAMRQIPEYRNRQFPHMLRFFCFPDQVERIASVRELWKIVAAFNKAPGAEAKTWDVDKLDAAVAEIRKEQSAKFPGLIFDFYAPEVLKTWEQARDNWGKSVVKEDPPTRGYKVNVRRAQPLNQILHGPPGTGKTYRAMRMAVEICTGEALDEGLANEDVASRFEALRQEGRIALATFHQSTSYEDFIEGLRPESRPDGTLAYSIKPGLFRAMCDRARGLGTAQEDAEDIGDSAIWKMSLGAIHNPKESGTFDQCLEKSVIALGYGRGLDFTGCDTRDEVWSTLKAHDAKVDSGDFDVSSMHAFKNKMQTGDLVVVTHGNLRFRAIGRVTGDYQPPKSNRTRADGIEQVDNLQTRSVSWLWTAGDAPLPYDELSSKRFSQQTIYELDPAELDLAALQQMIRRKTAAPAPNHVLIIDEINRGNVARILGELITCLEPQRRLGAAEETKVQLTYSQLHFGVPGNLYLIGTMNTADRSIAFLDSALRRRFTFTLVAPEPGLLEDIEIDGLELDRLLTVMNQRLAVLLDEDHQLGHSYFLRVETAEDVRRVLVDQVIPLLREQFHGDQVRWCQALGCAFDPESGSQGNARPVLKAEPVRLGKDADVRIRVRLNPAFLDASGEELVAYLNGIIGTD